MKLATFIHEGKERVGIVDGDGVIPVPGCASMEDLIRTGLPAELPHVRIPLEDVRLLAPIPRPSQDVICLGMNFADHTHEAAKFHPTLVRESHAVYFSKHVNEAVPDGGVVDSHPDVTSQVDYEAEVAVIIGRDALRVKKENARGYVFGYTILNDISAREVQTRHKQFFLGKSLDGFAPLGPWIVTADEFPFPPAIGIRCRVNGELRQDGNTSSWIYGIEDVIEELSAGMLLKAGTIISMGTPAGVGMGFQPPKFLKKGDVVICEADGIGTLTNRIG
ncbi:MAG: fumarylacetoacetate hydrolase family protein [Mailhella sp.]|jgi:2-keto-4-pentenoate hydratase/2-oxohepta-3-ene-1,7-dioic acid hydratase in catechol pathway|nr:fumarylacetoacetate hydrolase family protein [Mailhella sp.]